MTQNGDNKPDPITAVSVLADAIKKQSAIIMDVVEKVAENRELIIQLRDRVDELERRISE